MPTKYRKKPVVVEAVLYDGGGESAERICDWIDKGAGWIAGELVISTLEGDMHVSPGDFVIKGVQGEFYPCKPDIFAQTYELVED